MNRAGYLPALLIFGLLTACTQSTDIRSNKAEGYSKAISRLFVSAALGTALSPAIAAGFADQMRNGLAGCGIPAQVDSTSGIADELKSRPLKDRVNFHAPFFLGVQTDRTERRPGHLQYKLILSLYDVAESRVVWKALLDHEQNTSLVGEEESGRDLAAKALGRLAQDGLIQVACVPK